MAACRGTSALPPAAARPTPASRTSNPDRPAHLASSLSPGEAVTLTGGLGGGVTPRSSQPDHRTARWIQKPKLSSHLETFDPLFIFYLLPLQPPWSCMSALHLQNEIIPVVETSEKTKWLLQHTRLSHLLSSLLEKNHLSNQCCI